MNINPVVDQALRQRRLEVFTVEGAAENVLRADEMAWSALESVLGNDPVAKWSLKVMLHDLIPADTMADGRAAVKFHAEFLRQPDEGAE